MAVGLGVGTVVDVAAVQKGVILAVGDNGLAQRLGRQHGGPHPVLRLNAPSVIGKSRHKGGHARQIRQNFPFFAHSNRTIGVYVNAGGVPDFFQL